MPPLSGYAGNNEHAYIARLDTSGKMIWHDVATGHSPLPAALCADQYENLHVTGMWWSDEFILGGDTLHISCTSNNGFPAFLARNRFNGNFSTTHLADLNSLKMAAVFPNPSTGMLYIRLGGGTSSCGYHLYNALGMLVQQGLVNASNFTIAFDVLPGVYYLRLNDGKNARNISIVKAAE